LLCLAYHVIAFEETSKACTARWMRTERRPATPDDRTASAEPRPSKSESNASDRRTQRIKRVGELISDSKIGQLVRVASRNTRVVVQSCRRKVPAANSRLHSRPFDTASEGLVRRAFRWCRSDARSKEHRGTMSSTSAPAFVVEQMKQSSKSVSKRAPKHCSRLVLVCIASLCIGAVPIQDLHVLLRSLSYRVVEVAGHSWLQPAFGHLVGTMVIHVQTAGKFPVKS